MSKLENAIEDAHRFYFWRTWACWEASNNLKSLTHINTKKQQEQGDAKYANDWCPYDNMIKLSIQNHLLVVCISIL
jgi:hypothetical protein